jgi:hypothetical protein
MDKFLEKHRKAVLLVVDELSKKISDSFQIDRTELNKLVELFFEIKHHTKCQGMVVSKNNTPCTCMAVENEIYCRRHLYLKHEGSVSARPRCAGVMRRGKRCVHQAAMDSAYCKKHMYQQETDENEYQCVHYTLNDDGEETFVCDIPAIVDEWCCHKHQANNRLYAQQFKAKSIQSYLDQIKSGQRAPHELLSAQYT